MKRDLYTEVSARILAELEKGALPWVKPWASTNRCSVIVMSRECQEEMKARLRAERAALRPRLIEQINEFVQTRTDQHRLTLPSLEGMTTRDLEWIVAAFDNS